MSHWYHTAFTEHYWRFAEPRLAREQTASEVAYLEAVLIQHAPGLRVADLGCGIGRHAIGLAQAGFQVKGMDLSAWALGEAARRGKRTGAPVRWERADLLTAAPWPLAQVDAAICIDSFGWGSDADQRRLLRRLRRHLVPHGLLVLVCADAFQALPQEVSATVGETTYLFRQQFDPLTGRSHGSLSVAEPGRPEQIIPHDLRLYTPIELAALMREAGFMVDRVQLGFAADRPMAIQIIAFALPAPPEALAAASWRTPDEPRLDLRYNPDETDWLSPSSATIWEELMASEDRQGVEAVGSYAVNDPYGGERGAQVVAAYFDCPVAPRQLTLGPGVTSLLHDLSGLADGGLILAPQLVHPDLTAWALARGSEVCFVEEPATAERLVAAIEARRPSLVNLDRPSFVGELMALDDVQAVAEAAARVGAAVVIDESPATYLGPANSAAPLVNQVDNLIVLRSVTKGYSWGGLRVGFAVASDGLSERVRELVSPLQVGELSFRALLRLLMAGDIFQRLRARFRTTKPRTIALLRALGLEVIEGHPDLGWVVLPDAGGETSRLLDRLGVRGLSFVPSPALRPPYPELLHLTVPLSEERMAKLCQRLEAPVADARPARDRDGAGLTTARSIFYADQRSH